MNILTVFIITMIFLFACCAAVIISFSVITWQNTQTIIERVNNLSSNNNDSSSSSPLLGVDFLNLNKDFYLHSENWLDLSKSNTTLFNFTLTISSKETMCIFSNAINNNGQLVAVIDQQQLKVAFNHEKNKVLVNPMILELDKEYNILIGYTRNNIWTLIDKSNFETINIDDDVNENFNPQNIYLGAFLKDQKFLYPYKGTLKYLKITQNGKLVAKYCFLNNKEKSENELDNTKYFNKIPLV